MNKTFFRKIMFTAFAIILTFFIFNDFANAETTSFTLSDKTAEITVNSTKFLTYTGGEGEVTWESDNTDVATVDDGTIRAKSVGTAKITAKRGTESDTCIVTVIYNRIVIGGNAGSTVSTVNLILGEHSTEKLFASVKDGASDDVPDAEVTWTSSAPDTVKVDSSTGLITALKTGTATITAKAAGVEDTCEVTVYDAPMFTNFSSANFETEVNWTDETLKITGITPVDSSKATYYYAITPTNAKLELLKEENGSVDEINMNLEYLSVNADENYIFTNSSLSKYMELNQDIYIWIVQNIRFEDGYFDESGNYISSSCKYVVEGKKIERAELPQLNLILQSFDIAYYESSYDEDLNGRFTFIKFNFPTDTDNRKFKLKIGKVTDSSILSKIKNNDYNGIIDLLNYAKNNNAVYEQDLVTSSEAYFRSTDTLFDGRRLLEDDAYYYIYAVFDDENGKYYPIEGVTLGQASFSELNNSWDLYAYTTSNFSWDNLSSSYQETPTKKDDTTAPGKIPQTGATYIEIVLLVVCASFSVVSYIRYKKLKDIK